MEPYSLHLSSTYRGRFPAATSKGCSGVAFPPDYAKKRYFYVNYTNTEGDTVIARYRLTSDSNVADSRRAEIILRIDQPNAIHNGGHMAFGPNDGYLYIGAATAALWVTLKIERQDPSTLLGKATSHRRRIGRVSVRYSRRQPVRSEPPATEARFGPWVCAIPGVLPLTSRPATCTSVISGKVNSKRSTTSQHRAKAVRTMGWGDLRRYPLQ